MNTDERKYRFTEIATTIDLLPEVNMESLDQPETDDWKLPNGTIGLSDSKLFSALICQTLKGAQDYRFKMVATLSNTALSSIREKDNRDEAPSDDDLTALCIAINVLWAEGVANGLFQMLGMMSSIVTRYDLDMPELATAIFRPQSAVEKFDLLDPIRILEGKGFEDALDILSKD